MVKEKDYFVLVSERPSLNGSPDDIVEQTLKISDTGLAWFATRTARQKETGRGYHEKYVSRIGEWRAEILLRMTDRVKQRAEFPSGDRPYMLTRHWESSGDKIVVGQQNGVPILWQADRSLDLTEMYQRFLPFHDIWAFGRCMPLPQMNWKERIHQFAEDWIDLLNQRESNPKRFWLHFIGLGHECAESGFYMDTGKEFRKRYPDCFDVDECDYLEELISSIDDRELIGSAIFSMWRYKTHWETFDGSIIWPDNAQKWFLLLFQRLEEMTRPAAAKNVL